MSLHSDLKKLFIFLLMILLSSCSILPESESDPNDKYQDMIELINTYDTFESTSDYFDISIEKIQGSDGLYYFYITLDEPRIAMYDVEAIAIEKGVDYSDSMAGSAGIFEESEYSLIPNQANPAKGYYAGIVLSGTLSGENADLYILVQWKSRDKLTTKRQYLVLSV